MNWTIDETETLTLSNITNVTDLDAWRKIKLQVAIHLMKALGDRPIIDTQEYIIIASYSLIILVSIFGNLLVCNILCRNSRMRSSTYVFIANLALSDFLLTVLNIPFNVARLILPNWPFGSFMCSMLPLVQVASVYVSTFTMTCIAGDRFRMVRYPLKPRLKRARAIQAMVIVWLLAIVLALPHAIFNKVESVFTYRHMIRCRTIYPVNMNRWIIMVAVSTQYVLPLAITGVYYCRIMVRIWSRNALGVVTEGQMVVQAKAKRKTIKMLLLVVILFAICWLPLNIFNILREFDALGFLFHAPIDHLTAFVLCHWLAMSSVCYNPFIYCCLNEHFRSGAVGFFLCIKKAGQRLNSSIRSTIESKLTSIPCDAQPANSGDDPHQLGNDDDPTRVVNKSSNRREASYRSVCPQSMPMCTYGKTEVGDLKMKTEDDILQDVEVDVHKEGSNDV